MVRSYVFFIISRCVFTFFFSDFAFVTFVSKEDFMVKMKGEGVGLLNPCHQIAYSFILELRNN